MVLPHQPFGTSGRGCCKKYWKLLPPRTFYSGPRSSAIYPCTIATRKTFVRSCCEDSKWIEIFCQYFARMFTLLWPVAVFTLHGSGSLASQCARLARCFAAMKIRKGKRNIIIANIFISNFSILYSILKRLNSNRSREINKWNVFDMQNDLSWSNGRSNKKW